MAKKTAFDADAWLNNRKKQRNQWLEDSKREFLAKIQQRRTESQEWEKWMFQSLPGLKPIPYGKFQYKEFRGFTGWELNWDQTTKTCSGRFIFTNVESEIQVRILLYDRYGCYIGEFCTFSDYEKKNNEEAAKEAMWVAVAESLTAYFSGQAAGASYGQNYSYSPRAQSKNEVLKLTPLRGTQPVYYRFFASRDRGIFFSREEAK